MTSCGEARLTEEERDREDAPSAETSVTEERAVTQTGSPSGAGETGTSPAPGEVLAERYWIQKLLGRGGMGEVWHALDL